MAAGDFNPEIWTKDVLKNWDENFPIVNCTNQEHEKDVKGDGDTVIVFVVGDITVNTYSGTVTYETPSQGNESMALDQDKYWAFNVPDIDKVQSKPNIRKLYTKRADVAYKRNVEQYLLGASIVAAIGNEVKAQTTGGDFSKLTSSNVYTVLNRARRLMEDDNTWIDGEMWLSVPPVVTEMIRNSTELTHATEKADEFIKSGTVTKLAGWNLLQVDVGNMQGAGSDADPYHMIGGNKDGINFVQQIKEMEGIRRDGSFATGVRGLFVYGAKVFTQNTNAVCVVTVEV